jgi:hypothetical protein
MPESSTADEASRPPAAAAREAPLSEGAAAVAPAPSPTPRAGGTVRRPLIQRPVILLGALRSGTTMVFQALSAHPDLWSLYSESQAIVNPYYGVELAPGKSSFVGRDEVDDTTAIAIERDFFNSVGNLEGGPQWISKMLPLIVRTRVSGTLRKLGQQKKVAPIRIVEKTPGNCYRIQLLDKVFPDAQFVFVVRDPRGSIASIYHGWREEPRFQAIDLPQGFTIPDYQGKWCFGVPPEWPELNGRPLVEICAYQWVSYNEHCLRDLPEDPSRLMTVRYEELSSRPGPILRAIADWADLDHAPLRRFDEKLPVVNTWTKPSEDKWRRYEAEILSVTEQIAPMSQRLGYDLSA